MANIGAITGPHPVHDGEESMEQLALTVAEACAAARVGKTALYEAIASGALVARKRGRKTLVLPLDLEEWVRNLPSIEPKSKAGHSKAR